MAIHDMNKLRVLHVLISPVDLSMLSKLTVENVFAEWFEYCDSLVGIFTTEAIKDDIDAIW